jgi:hypothetical protein
VKKNWVLAFGLLCALTAEAEMQSLSKERYLDKVRGAWAGQMIGVCYGAPYEFQSNAKPIETDLRPWSPERVAESIGQDDLYVEMTFLMSLEKHGLGVTPEQAGRDFGASEYELWHANKQGRNNIRAGIMPPLSGHPTYNPHADDIDFQIEADLFGILCPGLPHESNKLCDVFGHIMNYGDGVYGGMFVAGMYAAAYFEDKDILKVIEAGLDCIPDESLYEACIRDVVKWHKQHPADWLAAWHKLEEKWQDDVDCSPGEDFNIDAKINGAYIVMGLLYGKGDFVKTMEISTRCGQDADCNPSSAVGVLGCMMGYSAIPAEITSGIEDMADDNFAFTDYSFHTLVPATQRMTEAVVRAAGGEVTATELRIPVQQPKPPATFEQWVSQKEGE